MFSLCITFAAFCSNFVLLRIYYECEIRPDDHHLASRGLAGFFFATLTLVMDSFSCSPLKSNFLGGSAFSMLR